METNKNIKKLSRAKYKQEIIDYAEKHKVYNLENLFFNYHPEDIENHQQATGNQEKSRHN
jgi:hypothetical protein